MDDTWKNTLQQSKNVITNQSANESVNQPVSQQQPMDQQDSNLPIKQPGSEVTVRESIDKPTKETEDKTNLNDISKINTFLNLPDNLQEQPTVNNQSNNNLKEQLTDLMNTQKNLFENSQISKEILKPSDQIQKPKEEKNQKKKNQKKKNQKQIKKKHY